LIPIRAFLRAEKAERDRDDARGIAQMMRVGLYRRCMLKTIASQKCRMLLTSRKLLQTKAIDIDNDLRGTLRNFGLKVGVVGKVGFEGRIWELVQGRPDLAAIAEALLAVRAVLRQQLDVLNTQLLAIVRADEVCRRLMTIPGVGPVVALTFRTTVDVPVRFKNSKKVGAAFGLAPRQNQSGESTLRGRPDHANPFSQMVVAQSLGDEKPIARIASNPSIFAKCRDFGRA
jgi:transposase